MAQQLLRILSELFLLFFRVRMVFTIVAGHFDKPDGRADEDVEVFDVWLHGGYGLDGGGAGADDAYALAFPLFCLVFGGPAGGVYHLSLKGFKSLDFRPFELVQHAGGVEEDVTFIDDFIDAAVLGGLGHPDLP